MSSTTSSPVTRCSRRHFGRMRRHPPRLPAAMATVQARPTGSPPTGARSTTCTRSCLRRRMPAKSSLNLQPRKRRKVSGDQVKGFRDIGVECNASSCPGLRGEPLKIDVRYSVPVSLRPRAARAIAFVHQHRAKCSYCRDAASRETVREFRCLGRVEEAHVFGGHDCLSDDEPLSVDADICSAAVVSDGNGAIGARFHESQPNASERLGFVIGVSQDFQYEVASSAGYVVFASLLDGSEVILIKINSPIMRCHRPCCTIGHPQKSTGVALCRDQPVPPPWSGESSSADTRSLRLS